MINLITYKQKNLQKSRNPAPYYESRIMSFRCHLNYQSACRSLYDQMAMTLKRDISEIDIIIYNKNTNEVSS